MTASSYVLRGALLCGAAFAAIAACGGTADLGGTAPTTAQDGGDAAVLDGGAGDAAPSSIAIDPEAAARMAVFVGSCLVPESGMNAILTDIYQPLPTIDGFVNALHGAEGCFATKSNGCAAIPECLPVQFSRVASCTQGCDGDDAVDCERSSAEYRFHCAKIGKTCRVANGSPGCVDPASTPCDRTTYTTTCQGDEAMHSADGEVRSGGKCAVYGLTCAPNAYGDAGGCVATGAACTAAPPGQPPVGSCAADGTLHACVGDREATVDCDRFTAGFSCQTNGGRAFCGRADECNPATKRDATCDGTSIVLCNAGKTTKIDCKALGFTSCVEGDSYAVCAPSDFLYADGGIIPEP